MAKTKLAAPLAGIRGTVGGLIYSANGSGTFVKAWARPSNPKSQKQSIERSYLASMPGLWSALSSAQRAAWDTFAALAAQQLTDSLGQAYYISGYLWFVKCNIRLLRVGRATIQAPPTIARPAAPTINDFRIVLEGSETDLCSGGTPTASTSQVVRTPDQAFDDNLTTWWSCAIGGIPSWLEYQLTASTVVRKYALYFHLPLHGAVPKDWTFEGYNGATWDVLDTVTTWPVPSAQWYYFPFPNETSYTRYRIQITAVQIPAIGYSLITEMQYFPGEEGMSVISYPAGTFSTITYDLILHISMVNSQARIVQYPGFLEILALQSPGDFSQEFQDELTAVFGTLLEGRRWFAKLYRQTVEGIRSAAATTYADTETP